MNTTRRKRILNGSLCFLVGSERRGLPRPSTHVPSFQQGQPRPNSPSLTCQARHNAVIPSYFLIPHSIIRGEQNPSFDTDPPVSPIKHRSVPRHCPTLPCNRRSTRRVSIAWIVLKRSQQTRPRSTRCTTSAMQLHAPAPWAGRPTGQPIQEHPRASEREGFSLITLVSCLREGWLTPNVQRKARRPCLPSSCLVCWRPWLRTGFVAPYRPDRLISIACGCAMHGPTPLSRPAVDCTVGPLSGNSSPSQCLCRVSFSLHHTPVRLIR